jgi:hypothetical protein
MASDSQDKISFIEMHDARVGSISRDGNSVVIGFTHLPVYRHEQGAEERERLWFFEAEVRAEDVRGFESNVQLDRDDWVRDGWARLADGSEVDLTGFVDAAGPCAGFTLKLASDVAIEVDCASLHVRLGPGSPTREVFVEGDPRRLSIPPRA